MSATTGSYHEFVGVYNADATLWGELSYWVGARLGIRHCSLCDITHGLFTERADWQACVRKLGVAFTTFHINNAPPDVAQVANGNYPIVLGRNDAGLHVVLTAEQIDACNGSAEELLAALSGL